MPALSTRVAHLAPSPTLGITAKAHALKAAGHDIISFGAGEPDFNTPEPICAAAIEAMRAGHTKYTPSVGIPALREAVAHKLARENGVHVRPEQVMVSCGAKHSVFNAIQAVVNPGDEVILFAPYWMTYAEQIRLAGATPVVVATSAAEEFVPDHAAIRAAITPRTRAILINSPSNPTGAVFPRQTIKEIAAEALRHDLWIISDEIYEKLVYGVEAVSPAALGQEVAERTLTIGGCSKSYAMTGWRLGFTAGPAEVIKAMGNYQDQVTSNPTSFVQYGAVVAFNLPSEAVETMRAEFQSRRDLIVDLLGRIPGVHVHAPKGAFYAFPDFSDFFDGDDASLTDFLLEKAGVAVVPGSVFEGPGHLRLSYATSKEAIKQGVERIGDALAACPA
jgi:aspartate aminotransferase